MGAHIYDPYLGYDDDNYGHWDEPECEEDRIEKEKFRTCLPLFNDS